MKELLDGTTFLLDGTIELRDGVIKFNDEGIKKLTDLFNVDLKNLENSIKITSQVGKEYNNFSGLEKGKTGKVSFIYKTEEIKHD